MRRFIDEEGYIKFGKYDDVTLDAVAAEDPEYLSWLLDAHYDSLTDDEVAEIEEALLSVAPDGTDGEWN